MFKKFARRATDEEEIIDDFTLTGQAIEDTFASIEKVNRWLGGNRVFVDSLAKTVRHPAFAGKDTSLTIYDLGCGIGDGLCALADWSRKRDLPMAFHGLDANPYVVELAKEKAADYPEIQFRVQDIFSPAYSLQGVDIVTFNLCLHHFREEEIRHLLHKCREAGVRAVLINDLHRHWLAYYLFELVCWVFRSPRIARLDGLLSIRKGFTRRELRRLAGDLGVRDHLLRWRWAFRYQCVFFW